MATEVAEQTILQVAPDTAFVAEAIRRAEAAGYRPAQLQRPIDWATVRYWEERALRPDFAWREPDHGSDGAIIVGPTPHGGVAVHSGQHRILGGLMAHRPVPRHLMTWISLPDRGRGWADPQAEPDMMELLSLGM